MAPILFWQPLPHLQETCDLTLKDTVSQLREQRDKVVELKRKVSVLEQALGRMAGEFEKETRGVQERALLSTEAGRLEMDKLQKVLAMREREMNRVKRLARSVVEQRTELEVFFQEALAQVKQEVQASRQQHKHAGLQHRSPARGGRQDQPRSRNFGKSQHSTADPDDIENWFDLLVSYSRASLAGAQESCRDHSLYGHRRV